MRYGSRLAEVQPLQGRSFFEQATQGNDVGAIATLGYMIKSRWDRAFADFHAVTKWGKGQWAQLERSARQKSW